MKKTIVAIILLASFGVGVLYYWQDLASNSRAASSSNVTTPCSSDVVCKTPIGYLSRSSCPFQSMCIENACAVVCPNAYNSREDDSGRIPQCTKTADCNCSSFYGGSDLVRCLCLRGLCAAVVSGS